MAKGKRTVYQVGMINLVNGEGIERMVNYTLLVDANDAPGG